MSPEWEMLMSCMNLFNKPQSWPKYFIQSDTLTNNNKIGDEMQINNIGKTENVEGLL